MDPLYHLYKYNLISQNSRKKTQVQIMKREAELQLNKQRFGEKREINKIKKGIVKRKKTK